MAGCPVASRERSVSTRSRILRSGLSFLSSTELPPPGFLISGRNLSKLLSKTLFSSPCPSSCPCLFLISAKTRQNQQATFVATKAFILLFEISLHAYRHSVSEQGQAAVSQGFYRLTGFPDSWATMLSFAHTSRKHIFTSSLAVPQFCAARGRAASCAMDAHWLQESKVSVSLFCWPLDAHTPTVTPGHGMTQKWAQPGHWQAQRRGGHRRGRNKSCQPFPNTRLKNKFAELC